MVWRFLNLCMAYAQHMSSHKHLLEHSHMRMDVRCLCLSRCRAGRGRAAGVFRSAVDQASEPDVALRFCKPIRRPILSDAPADPNRTHWDSITRYRTKWERTGLSGMS